MKKTTRIAGKWATGVLSVATLTLISAPVLAQNQPPPPPPAGNTFTPPTPPPPTTAPPPPTTAPPPPVTVQPPSETTIQAPPPVISAPGGPAPMVSGGTTVTVGVPDSYIWDGQAYVGYYGDQYYYLAPNNIWMPLEGDRRAHFIDWQRDHHDWYRHAIQNERYRRDMRGHEHPWRGENRERQGDEGR